MHGCQTCGRLYAPRRAPPNCGECGSQLRPLALSDALELARQRQDRLRRERLRRLTGANPSELSDPAQITTTRR